MARISLGSHASDGLRVGPIYTQISAGSSTAGQPFIVGNYDGYGPGLLLSPLNTYRIWPSPANQPGGYAITNNIVAAIRPTGAGYLPLRSDGFVTFADVGSDGNPLIQFDWPRVPTVTVIGAQASAAANIYVTIIGYDRYGFPLQHTYTIGGETALPRTYPTVLFPGGANDSTIVNPQSTALLPAKAFYQITKVYISGGVPAGCTISVGASDIFGLPYAITSKGNIAAISWASQTNSGQYPNLNAINRASELTVRVVGSPQTTVGAFVPADVSVATATTGDVRGLYAPSSASSVQTDGGGNVVDIKQLYFTYYVFGFDVWKNQVANNQQNYMQQNKVDVPNGYAVSPLMDYEAVGVPQYYTGVPQG